MSILLLKLEGPLMSFGNVAIDERRGTDRHPSKSMVTGLIANAMGLLRTRAGEIQELQSAIQIASRLDRPGVEMTDYQTALAGDKGVAGRHKSFLEKETWSSRGYLMGRSNTAVTYQIWKDYRVDASVTVAVSSADAGLFEKIVEAVRQPKRPVFLGRKSCLPTRPIFEAVTEASDVFEALVQVPVEAEGGPVSYRWPSELGDKGQQRANMLFVSDLRDWTNAIHTSQRSVYEAFLEVGTSND